MNISMIITIININNIINNIDNGETVEVRCFAIVCVG